MRVVCDRKGKGDLWTLRLTSTNERSLHQTKILLKKGVLSPFISQKNPGIRSNRVIVCSHGYLLVVPYKLARFVDEREEDQYFLRAHNSVLPLKNCRDIVAFQNADECDRLSIDLISFRMDLTWRRELDRSIQVKSSEPCRTIESYSNIDLGCNVHRHHDPCQREFLIKRE